jgi:hypothetical protein
MDLQHYETMLHVLDSKIESYVADPLARAFLSSSTIDDLPPLLLKSSSCPMSLCFIRRMCKIAHGGKEPLPLLELQEGVLSNVYMFHVNLSNQHSFDMFEFVTNSVQQKRPCGDASRHIVVFNIVDKLRHAVCLGIKSIVSKWSSNALFIIRNDGGYFLPLVVTAMFQIVRVSTSCCSFAKDFEHALGGKKLPLVDKDPMNMCIALEGVAPFDALQRYVYMTMDKLGANVDKPINVYGKLLRDFCVRIGASCVPVATIAMHILEKETNVEYKQELVSILARMEHGCAIVSKPIFTLELEIDRIVRYSKRLYNTNSI